MTCDQDNLACWLFLALSIGQVQRSRSSVSVRGGKCFKSGRCDLK